MSDQNKPDQSSNIDPILDDRDDQPLQSLADLPDNLIEAAMKQLTDPNRPVLDDREIDHEEKEAWENPDELAVNDNGKNKYCLICPFCRKSKIILPDVAQHVKKEIFLPYPTAKSASEGCVHDDYFKVTSKMDFENIEVKRAAIGDDFRYLTCADCGSGPLGIIYDADNNRVFYLSHNRTRYIVK